MADDIASLGFAVDSKPLLEAAAAADKLAASGKNLDATAKQVRATQTASGQATMMVVRQQQQAVASSRALVVANAEIADRVDLLGRAQDRAYQSLSTRSFFRLMAREAQIAGGPLGDIIGRFGLLTVGGQRLGVGITAGTIAISAMVSVMVKLVEQFAAFEQMQAQTNSALRLTGQASGQTADGLDRMARAMAADGTIALATVREAQAELLRFKTIGASAFGQVLEASKQLASTGFTDMKSAAKTLAEAMKDPANAGKILSDVLITVTANNQADIDAFLRKGRVLEAQALLLDIITTKTKNLDQSATTLQSSWNRLWNIAGENFIAIGKWIAEVTNLKKLMDSLTEQGKQIKEGGFFVGLVAGVQALGIALAQQIPQLKVFADALKAIKDARDASQAAANFGKAGAGAFSGPTFDERFNAAGIGDAIKNFEEYRKKVADVTKELNDQLLVAGKNATELEIYNQTVARGIPLDTAGGQAIAGKVRALSSMRELRSTTDSIREQTAAQEIENKTLDMAIGPATAYRAAQTAIQKAIIEGHPYSEQQIRDIEKFTEKLGKAAEAANKFRGLREFIRDAKDLDKQLDQLAVSGLNSITTNLTDIATGAVSAADGFKALGDQIVRSITQMIIQMTIALPIAQALRAALGGGFGAGGIFGSATPTPSALGNVFSNGHLVRFASGGLVNQPTLFRMAGGMGLMGESGPEAVMPLQRGSDGKLGVSGGGSVVNVNVMNNHGGAGVEVQQKKNQNGQVDIAVIISQLEHQMASNVADGRGPFNAALTGRFGLTPRYA